MKAAVHRLENKIQSGKFEKPPARGLKEHGNQSEKKLEMKAGRGRIWGEVEPMIAFHWRLPLPVPHHQTPNSI